MEKYKVVTEKFEGPLDLLLHLINKDKLDIYDIPIASVTEQYLAYISQMQEFDIELASEFLVMAAILLQIKSRTLLPKQLAQQEDVLDEDEQDPRQQLADRLVTYKRFKMVAQMLAGLWEQNAVYATRQPAQFEKISVLPRGLSLSHLLSALANVISNEEEDVAYIPADEFHIQDKINDIVELLQHSKGRLTLKDTLIRSGSAGELVTSFLALLELMRTGKVTIEQPERFGNIYICLREAVNVL